MNWKVRVQLKDLDQAKPLELNCVPGGCGRTFRPTPAEVIERLTIMGRERPDLMYLDELETRLKCRGCGRRMVLLQAEEQEPEAFQGGMP